MDIQQLIYFREVAKTESITSAAKKLMVVHSTISKSIKALENELQTELFVREKNTFKLSSTGKELVPLVEQLIEDYYAIYSHFDVKEKTNHFSVGIGTGLSFLFKDIMYAILNYYDVENIQVEENSLLDLTELLLEKKIEFIVAPVYGVTKTDRLNYINLLDDEFVAVVKRDSKQHYDDIIDINTVVQQKVASFTSKYVIGRDLHNRYPQLKENNQVIESESWQFLLDLIVKIDAIAFLPALVTFHLDLDNYEIKKIKQKISGKLMFIYPKKSEDGIIMKKIAKEVTEIMQKNQKQSLLRIP